MNVKKIAAFAVGPIGCAVLGFITLPIITWFYSVEDIGRVAMLQVVSNLCILLFGLGLDQAYVREYHEVERKPALLKIAMFPGLLLLVIGLIFCFVVPNFISKALFSVDSVLISVLVALCFLAAFISRFLSLILRMQERGLAFSMSQVLPKLLFLLVIGTYVLFSFGLDLLHLVIAHTLSVVAVALVYTWNTRHEWVTAAQQKIDIDGLKAMLKFGIPLIISGAAFWGLTAVDKLFLRGFSTFEELGIYSVTSSFAAVATIFQSIFSTVWAPIVYKWAAEKINVEEIDMVTQHVLAVVVFLFVLAGLFSWLVTYLLPEQYNKVQYLLVACMCYPLFYTLSETTVVGIGIARKNGYALIASIIAVSINLYGNYLLVPKFGAVGAASSTAFSFWIFLVCRTEFSCLVWRKIPRLKLYAVTFVCLLAAIATSIVGESYHAAVISAWVSIGLASLFLFKSSLHAAKLIYVSKIHVKN